MTVIPLAAVSLKNPTHLHGVAGGMSTTVRSGEKLRAVLVLESGAVLITVKVQAKHPAKGEVDKVYILHLSDTHYTEPADLSWLPVMTNTAEPKRAAAR